MGRRRPAINTCRRRAEDEALARPRPFSIEAASDVMVTLIRRQGLSALAEGNLSLASFLRSVVLNELQRTQEHAATINMSAKNRFLAFLRDWLSGPGHQALFACRSCIRTLRTISASRSRR